MYAACSSTVTMVQLTISVYHTHVLHDTQLLQVLYSASTDAQKCCRVIYVYYRAFDKICRACTRVALFKL